MFSRACVRQCGLGISGYTWLPVALLRARVGRARWPRLANSGGLGSRDDSSGWFTEALSEWAALH